MKSPMLFVAAVSLVACASQPHPFSTAAAEKLKGRQVATTFRHPPGFTVTKPDTNNAYTFALVGVAGAAVGTLVAQTELGADLRREFGIDDPALSLSRELTNQFQRKYGLRLAPQPLAIRDEDPKQITATYPASDLILDLKTNHWSLQRIGGKTNGYQLTYVAELRIIDAKFIHALDGKKGMVIAHGTCKQLSDATSDAPTYGEFLANGAERLKQALDRAARSCGENFRSKVLMANDRLTKSDGLD